MLICQLANVPICQWVPDRHLRSRGAWGSRLPADALHEGDGRQVFRSNNQPAVLRAAGVTLGRFHFYKVLPDLPKGPS